MSTPPQRELKVDFFRGIAMFIILVAHVPGDRWALYIPARFGPSDAADIFVFCSGYASAVAFGGVFLRHGYLMGAARILLRFWQIYWAQICLFITTATVCVLGTQWLDTENYVEELNLQHFFDQPMQGIVGLITLTYVPNYFDILPMYMLVLLMVPAVMLLRRIHLGALIAASFALWASTKLIGLNLPAEWWSDRGWFFNPFAWQLIFFTGFAFGAGWIAPPEPRRWLIGVAAAYVILMIPLSHWPTAKEFEWIVQFRVIFWEWGYNKTDYGIFRWLHLIALGYLARCLFTGREQVLARPWAGPILVVGQNALAVFVFSMVSAQILGMALDVLGRDHLTVAAVNLFGFALLVLVARTAAFFRSEPWRRRPSEAPSATTPGSTQPAAPPGAYGLRGAVPAGAEPR